MQTDEEKENSPKRLLKEACVGSLEEARKAEKLGADRIELCYDLSKAGLTPPFNWISEAKKIIKKIPVFVIIRPTDRDFFYSDSEFFIMKKEILFCKENLIDGVVFGILKENENEIKIDANRMKELIEIAKPLEVTFHMAFDLIGKKPLAFGSKEDLGFYEAKFKAIDLLVDLGVRRILTKGGDSNAFEGKEILKKFSKYANGRIIILPGGGVNKKNKDFLSEFIFTGEVHGTKIVGDLS